MDPLEKIKIKTRVLSIKSQNNLKAVSDEKARDIIQEIWIQYAERLLNKVIEVACLDEEQADALRRRESRPNDFRIIIGYS